jgi:hypothetical protein
MSFEKPKHEKEPKPTRRVFLQGLGAAAVLAGAVGVAGRALHPNETKPTGPTEPLDRPPEKTTSFLDYKSDPQEYEMGELEGMRFSDLLAKYTGIVGKVPKKVFIDFKFRAKELWEEKISRGGKTEQLRATAQSLFDSYVPENAHLMDLAGYERQIDTALNEVRLHDMTQIKRLHMFKNFDETQMALLQRFESAINSKMLLAYATTEIMPTKGAHSDAGLSVLEFLLNNAGEEYVALLPALNDSELSFGPYQFTYRALDEYQAPVVKVINGKKVIVQETYRNGASLMNSILPKSQIPAHVADLRGADHHKAAYLYALYNIGCLVKRLGENDPHLPGKFLDHFDQMPEDTILEFIATAHHEPRYALRAFEEFAISFVHSKEHSSASKVDHGVKHHGLNQRHPHDPSPTYERFCKVNGLGDYCEKTASNMRALRERPEAAR